MVTRLTFTCAYFLMKPRRKLDNKILMKTFNKPFSLHIIIDVMLFDWQAGLRSCVKVKVAILGSPSLVVLLSV